MQSIDLYSYLYSLLGQIPEGMVTTYGDLAVALGDVKAARACGYMLSRNNDTENIPCYKVIMSDGSLGGYSLGIDEKIRRLRNDGIEINNGRIDLKRYRFNNFDSSYPLKRLQEEQEKIAGLAVYSDDYNEDKICAIDVSYKDEIGYSVMVSFENNEYDFKTFIKETRFPYIPGYLAYREFPYIKELGKNFDGTMIIDANGLLHPRRCGLATYVGVIMNKPSIGVAKSLLTGSIKNGYVYYNNMPLGYMINSRTIVSPGNRISLESSINFIRNLGKDHYPEILKIAHDRTVALRRNNII
ncbi:endonuclease V [Picrophilus oshimae]|uniref:Bifunctional methyltransferase/endonuclease n=1 Tax=Picrophilus torridus (strain ATCC 700027 / DSM 9790 / JCM 10055 / NBRC 100828 / KAW 2/3) TaxID=1122961 RepID=NFI_PICTO|nr:endonuclease V [Picrophilus oshimae]Q6KZ38.1 RecName: Full=Bifunctional methyltransferase/endonuclease; Includes: RecName: Full=Probable methylated-DNA--protein-cysteine methyltransferase; AltName: Full=O-6-methylbase-DNA-alkyltransferase; Includes: RecName: Full=Endonuclease V; AltName: Full=Deoxyinosine 3'endonuclease; AltName: Full=Deoxyribonuclease V; Short=DNase V [Picrophilus oshimae DSM 9789]AAT44014.1 O6-methylguanine-DNA methyltransferase/endonuclease V [Picrophilus oshimae DSM 9789]